MYFKVLPFSPPTRCSRGFFSDSYCETQVELLKVNLTDWWAPQNSGPLECLTQGCPPWASSTFSVTPQVCCPGTGPPGGFHWWISALNQGTLCSARQSPQSWGQRFVWCPPLSSRSKQSCRFFHPFSFLLVLGLSSDFQDPYVWNWTPGMITSIQTAELSLKGVTWCLSHGANKSETALVC